jgi:hypothetical protein
MLNSSYRSRFHIRLKVPREATSRSAEKGHDVLAHGETRPRIVTVEQPEMSKWTVILLLVHRPFFDFNQTMVGPFDFLKYLPCVWISFALCALTRKIRSFDVLTKAQW